MSLSKYLNPNASSHLEINGLYQLTSHENYKFIKLKCGFRNLYDELELIQKLIFPNFLS